MHFYVFPVVMEAIRDEFAISLTAVTATILVWGLCGAVTSPAMGAVIERWGSRRVLVMGTVLQAVSFVVVALAQSIEQVYVGFGLAALSLCANTYIAVSDAVCVLFERERGKAMGLAMLGLGVGGLVVPNVTLRLLGLGWHTVYWIYAAVALVMVPVIWWGMQAVDPAGASSNSADATDATDATKATGAAGKKADPQSAAPLLGNMGLLRTRSFWGLALGDGLTGLIFSFFTVHFVAFSTESGIEAATAALVFGLFLFLAAPGTVVIGIMADRYSVRSLTLLCYGLPVLLVPALFGLPNLLLLGLFALVPGFLAGGRAAIFPLAIGYSYGAGNVARVFGWLNVAFLVGMAIGPMLSGILHDRSGNYQSSFWAAWIVGGFSVVLVALIRPEPGWRTSAES